MSSTINIYILSNKLNEYKEYRFIYSLFEITNDGVLKIQYKEIVINITIHRKVIHRYYSVSYMHFSISAIFLKSINKPVTIVRHLIVDKLSCFVLSFHFLFLHQMISSYAYGLVCCVVSISSLPYKPDSLTTVNLHRSLSVNSEAKTNQFILTFQVFPLFNPSQKQKLLCCIYLKQILISSSNT